MSASIAIVVFVFVLMTLALLWPADSDRGGRARDRVEGRAILDQGENPDDAGA